MSLQDQGRQYHMWFGSGHAPVQLKPIVEKDGSTTEHDLEERLRTVVHGAIGALPRKQRPLAESQLQAGTLEKLTEAMAAWIYGSKMDAASFAHHFFDRAADDPVVASLRSAASDTVEATTRQQLAKASGDLAEAMKAVGLDNWSRFVAKAQTRAHFKATLAAIQKSRQPPDIGKDAIKPVSFGTIMAGVGAAVATAELDVPAFIAVGAKAIANKVLGDKPAPAEGKQDTPQTAGKEGAPESKPSAPAEAPVAAADKPAPSANESESAAGTAKVWAPPKDVTEKIPHEWGPGKPINKGTGLRWEDPKYQGNGVRIDKGDPKAKFVSQRTDHVVVRSKGTIIGRDGKPIVGSIRKNGPDAHIPLQEYNLVKMEQAMSELELPGMRDELIDYLKILSDPEYQRREWIKFLPEEDIYNDELDYIIHFLYDDTHLADDPHQTVGAILRNDKEAEVIKELIAALNGVFSKHSIDLEGADYIKLPEWANVIDCAKVALREIQ